MRHPTARQATRMPERQPRGWDRRRANGKVPSGTMEERTEPTGGGEAVTEAYTALKEKITETRAGGSASPSPPAEETATAF